MKQLLIIIFMTLTSASYGQSGIVILTEEFTLQAPSTNTVYVTMPNGTSTTTSITPESSDLAQHDIELNNIINSIISQGYKIIEAPAGWGGGFPVGTYYAYTRRIFFGNP
ncbi:hypothetical protein N9V83_01265 [Flavobacteriales bacterium]|nr:hypothetical protein [Flavobacteriales bacterium]